MGDRGNIIIDKKIWLYTHWTGSDLPDILRAALKRGRPRWDDRPYLTRIIFCDMLGGDTDGLTGFGIDYDLGDGGTDIDVDTEKQTVTHNGATKTFEEYIE